MSLSQSLAAANQAVLDAIAESDGPITMGLLPLSEADEQSCIEAVISSHHGSLWALFALMDLIAPAAACYAIASCASQAVTGGKVFWEPVSKKLSIDLLTSSDREALSKHYRSACAQLGVVMPDVSSMSWTNIAPMMAQASILHAWNAPLASGLKSTLRSHPIPDLEDETALDNFSNHLAQHINNNPNLKNILHTEVGGIVAHRVISGFLYNRYEILPPHLIAPMREAFASSGSGVTLKSPYVSFSEALGEFELVLPKQSSKFTTHQTHWLIKGIQHSAQTENRISESEIPGGTIEVQLNRLGMDYPNQKFPVTMGLINTFRVFDERNMREKIIKDDENITLPPGEYMVVMRPDASTNDPKFEEELGNYKILPGVSLRPGSEPLEISYEGQTYCLNSALKTGIYHTGDTGDYISLHDGTLLHYGPNFDFQAYIPKDQHKGTLKISVSIESQIILEHDQELLGHDEGVYDYSNSIEEALSKSIRSLAPGLHPIKVSISTSASSATRELWYWKGLERISDSLGFLCNEAPKNINFRKCKGINKTQRGCAFVKGYLAPEVLIALDSHVELHIPRAGVQATCFSSEDNWEEDLKAGNTLSVSELDTRIIKFRSGGFQQWTIGCNDREFAKLDRSRTHYNISLRSIVAQFGNSGQIAAVDEHGNKIVLFSYATSLIASQLKHTIDHAKGRDIWTSTIPAEDLGKLGLEIVDYTTDPDCKPQSPIEFNNHDAEDYTHYDIDICDGISARIRNLPAAELRPARITLSIAIDPEAVDGQLLILNVVHMPEGTDNWTPLYCKEPHNTSQLSIVSLNSAHELKDGHSWWNHLWHVNDKNFTSEMECIYADVSEDQIKSALDTISHLISIKYPTSVFLHSATYLLPLPHKLAKRRATCGKYDSALWWEAAAEEIAEHAESRTTPIVRSFLLANNYRSLAHPWVAKNGVDKNSPSNVIASFSLLGQVKAIGGRVNYAQHHYHIGTNPHELYESFDNWGKVMSGQDTHFGRFKFNDFFDQMIVKVQDHSEKCSILEQAPVLSARHLLTAITALNRRSRVLWKASESSNPDHMLQGRVQALTIAHRYLEKSIHGINKSIGYDPDNRLTQRRFSEEAETLYYPELPSLDSPQAKQLADLTWALCVTARATAHGCMPQATFFNLKNRFYGGSHAQHPINLVLTFAPELSAYYTALLDFALLNNDQQ